jgi:hypothetical protein
MPSANPEATPRRPPATKLTKDRTLTRFSVAL